jgi:hypothetical protein
MFHGKIYVPKDRELRHCIIEQHHDTHIARHAACFKTLKLISCNYWWPLMSHYIGIYVKHMHRAKSVESVRSVMLHILHTGNFLPDATMKLVLLFHSLVAIQSTQV